MDLHNWTVLRSVDSEFLKSVRFALVFGNNANEALLVTCNDCVYGIGTNISGCLGFGDEIPRLNPQKIIDLSGKSIEGFAFGGKRSGIITTTITVSFLVAYSSNGQIYQWRCKGQTYDPVFYQPVLLKDITTKISEVVCGNSHCAALSENGWIYTWGYNDRGQLGRITVADDSHFHNAVRVSYSVEDEYFIEVGCGSQSTVALTNKGKVFSWGCNRFGQLGTNGSLPRPSVTPTPVMIPAGKKIRKIACGGTHVLALTVANQLIVWGNNINSQLGFVGRIKTTNASTKYVRAPLIHETCLRFKDIGASPLCDFSAAVGEQNEVFMWGQCIGGTLIPTPTITLCKHIDEVFASYANPRIMFKVYRRTDQAKGRTIVDTLENELGNPENSDFTIEIQGKRIHAHKSILIMRSEFLKSMIQRWLKPGEKILTIKEKSFPVMEAYLRYIYTDKVDVDFDVIVDLLQLADEYNEIGLKELCELRMKHTMTVDRVVDYFASSEQTLKTTEDMHRFCFNYAVSHAKEVINFPGFQNWNEQALKQFIREYVKRKET